MSHTTFTTRPKRAFAGLAIAAAVAIPSGFVAADTLATSASDETVARTVTSPSATDIENLLYMRQEEKLAGDLYRAFAEAWDLRVFDNIERAEQTHAARVAELLAGYGVDDPVATMNDGEFADPELQQLYDELLERGLGSVEEALRVGALVEELDIDDLRSRASDVTEIDSVYRTLEDGSHNHLRAFVSNLANRGFDYEPTILSTELYQQILDGTTAERAGGQGNGAAGRGNPATLRDQDRDQECDESGFQNEPGVQRSMARRMRNGA